MAKLTIVANIIAKPEKTDLVKTELLKLIDVTRAEEGNISYDLFHDNDKPEHFLFHETWENRELWQIHMNNKYLTQYMKATDGCVDVFTLTEMTQIA